MAHDDEQRDQVSRRDFVRTAAAGVGAAALVGASPARASAAAAPKTWDRVTDVVVVGSGGTAPAAAGRTPGSGGDALAAGIEAAEAGAKVTIVEKGDHVGGLWLASGGHAVFGATHVMK